MSAPALREFVLYKSNGPAYDRIDRLTAKSKTAAVKAARAKHGRGTYLALPAEDVDATDAESKIGGPT